jgi:hypothetical protein
VPNAAVRAAAAASTLNACNWLINCSYSVGIPTDFDERLYEPMFGDVRADSNPVTPTNCPWVRPVTSLTVYSGHIGQAFDATRDPRIEDHNEGHEPDLLGDRMQMRPKHPTVMTRSWKG